MSVQSLPSFSEFFFRFAHWKKIKTFQVNGKEKEEQHILEIKIDINEKSSLFLPFLILFVLSSSASYLFYLFDINIPMRGQVISWRWKWPYKAVLIVLAGILTSIVLRLDKTTTESNADEGFQESSPFFNNKCFFFPLYANLECCVAVGQRYHETSVK